MKKDKAVKKAPVKKPAPRKEVPKPKVDLKVVMESLEQISGHLGLDVRNYRHRYAKQHVDMALNFLKDE